MNAVLFAVVVSASSLSIVPLSPIASDRCDLIELNHFHDESGRLVFCQVIFYDWSDADCRFQVRAWRLATTCGDKPIYERFPVRDWQRGGYRVLFTDSEILRSIHAAAFRETWTQCGEGVGGDTELAERSIFPREMRRELSRLSWPKESSP